MPRLSSLVRMSPVTNQVMAAVMNTTATEIPVDCTTESIVIRGPAWAGA